MSLTIRLLKCLIVLIGFFNSKAVAQDTESFLQDNNVTIRYNRISHGDTTIQSSGVFRITLGKKIEWTQNVGGRNYEYEVVSISGSWYDFDTLGEVTFEFKDESIKGKLALQRTDEEFFVMMEYAARSGTNIVNKFLIEEFQVE